MIRRELEAPSQVEEIDQISERGAVVIFKHSTRCPISSMAWRRISQGWDKDLEEIPFYYLDLLRFRETSDKVSVHYGVQHESPQIIVVENRQVIYQTSHNGINVKDIKALLNA